MTGGTTEAAAPRPARMLDALREPAFRRLCLANYTDAAGTWMERLAVGWFVLDTTGSVFLAALSFAARSAPNMFLGPFGGAVADRFPRPRVLQVTTATKALMLCVLAGFGFAQLSAAWPVLLTVALTSVARSSEQPTLQSMIGDIVGSARAASATSLHATGMRTIGLVASLTAGLLLDAIGPGPVFLLAAASSGLASLQYATLRVPRRESTEAAPRVRRSLWGDTVEGLRIALGIPVVITLLILAVVIEVFAFSFQPLLPALADRVLHVGASGLGVLMFATSLGGVLGVLSLTRLVEAMPRGRLLIGVTTVFALGLLGIAGSDRFVVTVALAVVVGGMAAMFDTLQWALLQASVPDSARGRVIGLWTTAIGFGWLGPVILGAIAEVFSTQWAIATGGSVALLVALVAAATPRLRQL